jgi:UDP-glucose 4-epimerase
MILLTGATGYIGSHLWTKLLESNINVVGIDNLSNSSREVVQLIEKKSESVLTFIEGDVRNQQLLESIFAKYSFDLVVHLAALKNIQDSQQHKQEYEDCNVGGLNSLLQSMKKSSCKKLIFSSSAAVYGDKATSPIQETTTPNPTNVYGETKLECERLIQLTPDIQSIILRFFNVSGNTLTLSKKSNKSKSPSLFDAIEAVVNRKEAVLNIFGDDWQTKDGTCVRDYIHISDLVDGHISAISLLISNPKSHILNLGLGKGVSVLEAVKAMEEVSGKKIPRVISARRPGDIAVSFANVELAKKLIGWSPKKDLKDICNSI